MSLLRLRASAPQQSLGGVSGGGIYAASDLAITDSVIENNTVYGFSSGGRRRIHALGNTNVTRTQIRMNRAVGVDGAGIYNEGNLTLDLSTVRQNRSAAGHGGGIYNYFSSSLRVLDSTIEINEASFGGGIYNGSGDLSIVGSTIVDNTADYDCTGECYDGSGGGIFNSDADLTIVNSTVSGNQAMGRWRRHHARLWKPVPEQRHHRRQRRGPRWGR